MVARVTRLVVEVASQVSVAGIRVQTVTGRVVPAMEHIQLVEAVMALRLRRPMRHWSEQRPDKRLGYELCGPCLKKAFRLIP